MGTAHFDGRRATVAFAALLYLPGCGLTKIEPVDGGPVDASDASPAPDAPDAEADAGSQADAEDEPAPLCDGSVPSADDAYAWAHDPCLWRPVTGLEACDVHEAILPSERFPRRIWSACH